MDEDDGAGRELDQHESCPARLEPDQHHQPTDDLDRGNEITQRLVLRDTAEIREIRHNLVGDRHAVGGKHLGDLANVHHLLDARRKKHDGNKNTTERISDIHSVSSCPPNEERSQSTFGHWAICFSSKNLSAFRPAYNSDADWPMPALPLRPRRAAPGLRASPSAGRRLARRP